jgi:hypothetical protein
MNDFNQKLPLNILNVNIVKDKIPSFTSEKLCEMIVCYRYLGFYPQIAEFCMNELSNRRLLGDNFDFEFFIEKSLNDLPKLDFKNLDVRSIINNIISSKKDIK